MKVQVYGSYVTTVLKVSCIDSSTIKVTLRGDSPFSDSEVMDELVFRTHTLRILGPLGKLEVDLLAMKENGMLERFHTVHVPAEYEDAVCSFTQYVNGDQLSGKRKNELLFILLDVK